MNVNGKKYFDDITFEKAAKLIRQGKLTLNEICEELCTSRPVLKRNMDFYFNISDDEGETNWEKIYKARLKTTKRKGGTRIVYECQSCRYESKFRIDFQNINESVIQADCCPKCGSYCIRKRELRNKASSGELKAAKMIGRKKKK